MPDTPDNQKVYPQAPSQEEGLGFPLARLVVVFGLATAALLDCAVGPYQGKETGELALFRSLLSNIQAGDVLLADRYYCSYFMVVLAVQRGLGGVSDEPGPRCRFSPWPALGARGS